MAEDRSGGAEPASVRRFQLVLAPHPRSAQKARAFVEGCCQTAGISGDSFDVAVLLTSETVTNAVIHGRSEVRLTVTVEIEGLLIEVADDNVDFPDLVEPYTGAVSGRGLSILDLLADSWGVTDDRVGKLVWFHLRT